MRLEHHLVGGYVRYISPYIIIIIISPVAKNLATSLQPYFSGDILGLVLVMI